MNKPILLLEKTESDTDSNYQRYLDNPELFDRKPNCATHFKRKRVYDVSSRPFTYRTITRVNYCHDRGCGYPLCMQDRYVRSRRCLSPYFACIKKPRHTILTARSCAPTRENKDSFKCSVKRVIRILSQDPHNPRTRLHKVLEKHRITIPKSVKEIINIVVFEFKIQDSGEMHPHVHIANNFSYLHDVVSEIWDSILGYEAICWVNLHSDKRNMLRYFAKRVAWAGLHVIGHREEIYEAKFIGALPYHDLISGSRLFFAQGSFESFRLSYFVHVLETAEHLKRLRFPEIAFTRGSCEKSGEIPPPSEDQDFENRLVLLEIRDLGYKNEYQFCKSAHIEYQRAWLLSRMDPDDLEELEAPYIQKLLFSSSTEVPNTALSRRFYESYNSYMASLQNVGGENH